MAITTPEAFLKALGKSQLLTPEQLAHAQDTLLLADNVDQLAEILVNGGLLTEWQATCLMAGQTEYYIGKYVLLSLLGRGGMGSVFLARHTDMKRQVALKIISRRVGRDPASRERFMSEARAAASLDHPNIVRAYDIDKDRERFYIVMEYVDGHDIEELVEVEGPLDFEFIVDCIRQAAKGLAHAHSRGVIHCDIKPSNLLVTESGTLKILDMGMARLVNQSAEDSSGDSDGRILGTVDYMAPEQAIEGPDFDHRADIYALGCTMYYMLTGHPPFDEGTLAQRIVQHQTQAPPDILAEHPDTPPELAKICLKMMAKNPADRFQLAEELVEVLDRWQPPQLELPSDPSDGPKSTGVAIDAEDYSTPQPLESEKPKKSLLSDERRLVFWMAVAAVIVGGLLAIVAVLMVMHSNTVEEGPRVMPSPQYLPETTKEEGTKEPSSPSKTDQKLPSAQPKKENNKPSIPQSPPIKDKTSKKKKTVKKGHQQKQKNTPSGNNGRPTIRPQNNHGSVTVGGSSETSGAGSIVKPPKNHHKSGPPKSLDPFKGFPRTVQLPSTKTDQPTVLGKLHLNKESHPTIQLLGGEVAIEGNASFAIVEQPDKYEWILQLVDEDNRDTNVARLWLHDHKIMFAWLEMPEDSQAAYLRNCLLKIDVGRASRFVSLMQPKNIDPLTIKLTKSKADKRLSTNEHPPKSSAMRVVITAVGGLPSPKDPKKTMTVRLKPPVVLKPNESSKVLLLEEGECRIELRVRYALQDSASNLNVIAYCRLATRRQPLKFNSKRVSLLETQMKVDEEKKRSLNNALQNNPDLSEKKRKARQREFDELKDEVDWIKQFLEWHYESDGVIHIQFQECMVVEGRCVVIQNARLSKEESPAKNQPPRVNTQKTPMVTPVPAGQGVILH